jgi:hypothetical protein
VVVPVDARSISSSTFHPLSASFSHHDPPRQRRPSPEHLCSHLVAWVVFCSPTTDNLIYRRSCGESFQRSRSESHDYSSSTLQLSRCCPFFILLASDAEASSTLLQSNSFAELWHLVPSGCFEDPILPLTSEDSPRPTIIWHSHFSLSHELSTIDLSQSL